MNPSLAVELSGDVPLSQAPASPRARLWPFGLWLCAFYGAWSALVLLGDLWPVVAAHWPIAAAMAVGSYVAGSTPMGGGTVGFPIIVLLFDQPATIGRGFSFAVQAIGMSSAAIYILCSRQPVAWRLLRWSFLGAAVGTPLGLALLAPHAPDAAVKLVFAVLWASFGVMTLVKVLEFARYQGRTAVPAARERNLGLAIGLVGGGCVASLTGVGTDMLVYTALVLLYRADLRTAIPTSVVLMAFTSLVGVAAGVLLEQWDAARYPIAPEVWANWLAAAPVVALGAPFGALVVQKVGRVPTLLMVSVLCVGQFVWTCLDLNLSAVGVGLAVGGVLLANLGFHACYRVGRRWAGASAG